MRVFAKEKTMSLYTVTIEDRIYKVSISGNRSTVNGEEVDARVLPLNRNGLHVLHHGKQAYEVFLSSQESDTYQMLMFGGRRIVTQITSRVKKHLLSGEDCQAGCLAAPMHGLVVDVPVHEGDTVEKGQTLVVLESMKMQMQLRSPRTGKIAKVTVQPGNQVEKGALLVQFE
jgi:biotin carboxyl carrier protein